MTKNIERRTIADAIQIRSNPDGTVGVRGYASVFDSEAYGEVIRSSAFNRSVAQKDDVRLLVNHDGIPMARTKSGTLELGIDNKGLWFDAPSLDRSNPDVAGLISAMERGDIDQCSFAGYFTDVAPVNGIAEVREVKLVDVSVVTYPWYEATSVSVTGDREVDRELVTIRSLAPGQRELIRAELMREEKPITETAEPNPTDREVQPEPAGLTVEEARALLGTAA